MKYTIKENRSHSIKILRSEFIGFLYRVEDSAQALEILREHQNQYQNATHNCYAYVLGYEAEIQYYSDAGEPGGSAGKPILNALLRAELSGVLAVVTRYYGGIKLGVKGLIEAYTQAVSETVKISDLVEYQSFKYYQIKCSYAHLEIIRHQLSCFEYQELSAQYAESVLLSIKVPEAHDQEVRGFLDGYLALGRLEYNLEV